MRHGEQPSCLRSSIFLMGQNALGNWVVQDQRGACGGIFVDRASAVRFAMFENGTSRTPWCWFRGSSISI